MRLSPAVFAMFLASTAHAQMYQCVKDGRTSFQDAPCDPASSLSKSIATAAPHMLWNGLKSGMTVDDVQKKIRNAKPGTDDWLASGARELLRVERVTLAGTFFDAGFFFDSGRFRQVNLSGSLMVSNEDNLRAFDRVSTDFRNRYGRETYRKVANDYSGLSASAEWLNDDGKVWASIVPITATTSMFNVGYVPKSSSRQ
jgi:hypothetical protein